MWFLYIMFSLFAFILLGNVAGILRTFANHK